MNKIYLINYVHFSTGKQIMGVYTTQELAIDALRQTNFAEQRPDFWVRNITERGALEFVFISEMAMNTMEVY